KGKLYKDWPNLHGVPEWSRGGLYCETAICTEGLRALDHDIDDPVILKVVAHLEQAARIELEKAAWRTRAGSVRFVALFRAERRVGSDAWPGKRVFELIPGGKLEILGAGQQINCSLHPPSGTLFEWRNGSPLDRRRDDLPQLVEDELNVLAQMLDA